MDEPVDVVADADSEDLLENFAEEKEQENPTSDNSFNVKDDAPTFITAKNKTANGSFCLGSKSEQKEQPSCDLRREAKTILRSTGENERASSEKKVHKEKIQCKFLHFVKGCQPASRQTDEHSALNA